MISWFTGVMPFGWAYFIATIIDILVIVAGYIVGVILWAITLSQLDDALSAAILIIFTVLTLVGYPVIMEITTRGLNRQVKLSIIENQQTESLTS